MSDQFTPDPLELDDDAHERLRGMLPAYAIVRLQGAPDSFAWQPLISHLATCASCREELDELLLLLRETATGAADAEPDMPSFDLSALPPFNRRGGPQEEARPLLASQPAPPHPAGPTPRELHLNLGATLLQAMRRPQLAGAFRQNGAGAPGAPGELHHQLSVGAPDPIDIGLDVALSDPQRSLYRLQVTVVATGDPFEQAGHTVTLSYEGRSAAAITDQRGCVVFSGVPHEALGRLQLSVQLCSSG